MGSPGPDKPFSNMENASDTGERDLSPPPPYSEHNNFSSSPGQPGGQGDPSLALLPKDPPPPYTDTNGTTVNRAYVQPQRQSVTTQPQSYQRHTHTSARTNSSNDCVACCAGCDFDGICELCLCLCCLCQICGE